MWWWYASCISFGCWADYTVAAVTVDVQTLLFCKSDPDLLIWVAYYTYYGPTKVNPVLAGSSVTYLGHFKKFWLTDLSWEHNIASKQASTSQSMKEQRDISETGEMLDETGETTNMQRPWTERSRCT